MKALSLLLSLVLAVTLCMSLSVTGGTNAADEAVKETFQTTAPYDVTTTTTEPVVDDKSALTLDDVVKISKKDGFISVTDFDEFSCDELEMPDKAFDYKARKFTIGDGYYLLAGYLPTVDPVYTSYVRLCRYNEKISVDVRMGDVEKFIEQDPKDDGSTENYLSTIYAIQNIENGVLCSDLKRKKAIAFGDINENTSCITVDGLKQLIADSSDCGADYELLKKILEVYPYYDKYGGANTTEISYWLDAGLTQYYGDERIDISGFDYESFSDKFPYQISDEGISKGIEENKKIKIKYTKYDPETRKSYSEQLYPVVDPTTYEPTEPSTKPEPDPNVNYGDVDGSGEPGVSDVIFCNKAVVQSVLLSDDEKKAADVNLDGNVDGLDVTLILQYAVNKIDSLPYLEK